MKRIFVAIAVLLLMPFVSYAQEIPLEKQLAQIYKNAEDATTKGDISQSDFWLARYMGLTVFNEETKHGYQDLIPLFKKREDLKPTAFISGKYDDSFIEFYARGSCSMWNAPDEGIDKEKREFVIQSYADDHYFVEITASPRLENWSIMKKPVVIAIIPLGKNPVIHSGKLDNGKTAKHFKDIPFDVEESFIHYVWQPEMQDLDGDGTPEVWIRYIKAWADGFSQELAIYKIKDDSELVLIKQFSGEAEGIARRLDGNKVEVGTGFTEKNVGHMGFDQTQLETWEYKDGKFAKTSEKVVPHILWSKGWEQYYFDGSK